MGQVGNVFERVNHLGEITNKYDLLRLLQFSVTDWNTTSDVINVANTHIVINKLRQWNFYRDLRWQLQYYFYYL